MAVTVKACVEGATWAASTGGTLELGRIANNAVATPTAKPKIMTKNVKLLTTRVFICFFPLARFSEGRILGHQS
jgi:hypothetical protein